MLHPTIKFTAEWSKTSINVVDIKSDSAKV